MITCVIAGGQTGVDQAAWRAAKSAGLDTLGWMPCGFRTEECDRPEFAAEFSASESRSPKYDVRTSLNVALSGLVLWLGPGCGPVFSPGFLCTRKFCTKFHKRLLCDADITGDPPFHIIHTLMHPMYTCVMVAGSRESRFPGIGHLAEAYLEKLFRAATSQYAEARARHETRSAERGKDRDEG